MRIAVSALVTIVAMTTAIAQTASTAEPQVAQSADTTDVYLYPAGHEPYATGRETVADRKQDKGYGRPFIRIYPAPADLATGRAVVACPGGGYIHLAWDHEGYDWAPFFNERGITYVVCNYRMPVGDWRVPMSDAVEALRYVRAHADELRVNPHDVGIMGSSAGGHLASMVATHAEPQDRPAFQILFYPVVTMDTIYTHRGSRDNLLGPTPTPDVERLFSNQLQVDSLTPPAIMLLADDDGAVPSPNSANYYLALRSHGIRASLHIYPAGGHGFGYREKYRFHDALLSDLSDWLSWLRTKNPVK